MVNFGLLAAEFVSLVWGTPANFNGFRVLAALLHGSPALGVSQTLRRWTEGATYIWQGGHYVGHWSTFLVRSVLCCAVYGSCTQYPHSFFHTTQEIGWEELLRNDLFWYKMGCKTLVSQSVYQSFSFRTRCVQFDQVSFLLMFILCFGVFGLYNTVQLLFGSWLKNWKTKAVEPLGYVEWS